MVVNSASRTPGGLLRAAISALFLLCLALPAPRGAVAQHASAAFIDQQTLVFAEEGQVADIDPANNEYEYADTVERNIDDPLVILAGSSLDSFKPGLAVSWSSNKDRSVWTVHLRHGVKFHTGRCCMTADDVKYSYSRSVLAGLGGAYMLGRFFSDPARQIKIIDPYTLEFDLGHPQPFFLAAMAQNYNSFILDAQAVRKHASKSDPYAHNWVSLHDAGSGPYMIQSWAQDQQVVMIRFPDYWGGWSGPHFSKVIMSQVADSTTRRELLERGQADITFDLTPQDDNALKSNAKVRVVAPYATEVVYIIMTEAGPLASPIARQALSYAFSYDALIKGIYGGYAKRSNGVIPSTVLGYNPGGFLYNTDLNRAKALAQQAGLIGKTLTYTYDDSFPYGQMGQIMKAQLEQIGVHVNLQALSAAAYQNIQYSGKASQLPNLMPYSWWPDYNDPFDMADTLVDSRQAPPSGNNLGLYHNSQVDAVLASMKYGTGNELINPSHRLQDLTTRLDPPAIWAAEPAQVTVLAANLQGVVFNPVDLRTFYFYPMHH